MAVEDANYFKYLYNPAEDENPVEVVKVTENSIEANMLCTTSPQNYSYGIGVTNTQLGLWIVDSASSVFGPDLGTITSDIISTSYAGMTETYYDINYGSSFDSQFTHKYKVYLNNTNKASGNDDIESNKIYYLTGFAFYPDEGDLSNFVGDSISVVYGRFENSYYFWSMGQGGYFWPQSGVGIEIHTPCSAYTSVTINQSDLDKFNNLKYGQIQTIKFTHTEESYEDGVTRVISNDNIKHYVRYKYTDDAIWSSWQEVYLTDNQASFTVVKKNGPEIKFQFARGSLEQRYSQTYYENGYFLSTPYEITKTTSVPDTPGELKKLEVPEYRIEIWKTRLSDEANYQFIDYLGVKHLNQNYDAVAVDLNNEFSTMLAKFEFDVSIGSDAVVNRPMCLFGARPFYDSNGTKTYNGDWVIFCKRISSTQKAIGIYSKTNSGNENNISYVTLNIKDDEKFNLIVDSFNLDGSGGGVFVNGNKIINSSSFNHDGSGGMYLTGTTSLFNMAKKTRYTDPETELSFDAVFPYDDYSHNFIGNIYRVRVYDASDADKKLYFDYRPCIRKSDKLMGMFDYKHRLFYEAKSSSTSSDPSIKYARFIEGDNYVGTEFGMLADISNICISSLNLSKERNLPDTLSVDIEYIQFKKKLGAENTKISDVIKPYLVDIVVKRNFETIFSGTLMYAKVTLQAVGKQTLTLQAVGYGEQLAKRYINCSYGDMNYPQIARQILYDAQHEMNWIDNYDFLSDKIDSSDENDTSYFNGWYATDENNEAYVPVKTTDTNSYLAHWKNGSIPLDGGCKFTCNKLSCATLEGVDQFHIGGDFGGTQFLRLEFYHCTPELEEKEITLRFEIETDDNNSYYQSSTLTFKTYPSNEELGSRWTKFSADLNIGRLSGFVKRLIFTNNSDNLFYINDFNVYRPTDTAYFGQSEANIATTIGYNLFLSTGYFDPLFNDKDYYSTDRIRHYHRQNAKEAIYNLSKLQDQNFEYIVDKDGKFIFKVAEGDLTVNNVATYPGQISEVSIERDANILYNVGYAINTHLYDNKDLETPSGQSFIWTDITNGCAIDEESIEKYKARVQMVQVDTTTRREIESEAQGAIYASDEVQNVPTLIFDSNIYNPGNIHLGDAFGININIDELFDFINGEYRVYGYDLSLSQDHVESMDITLAIPTILQLQLMTFPVTMKNMINNIKRLQVKSNK